MEEEVSMKIEKVQELHIHIHIDDQAIMRVLSLLCRALQSQHRLQYQQQSHQQKDHSQKEHHQKKESKRKGAPAIQTVDELLNYTKGDISYAKNIIKKKKYVGVEYGGKVYLVDPEAFEQMKAGDYEDIEDEYKEVVEAIGKGKVKTMKMSDLLDYLDSLESEENI